MFDSIISRYPFIALIWWAAAIASTVVAAESPADAGAAAAADSSLTTAVEFATDIQPIFNEHCVACHGGVKQAADVSFIHRDAALAVIEPGAPEDSLLIDRITSDDEYEIMPPAEHGSPLAAEEVEVLTRWIAEGAQWQQPWSYEQPSAPEIPETGNDDWCRSPLDRFVLARLQREGVSPAPPAQPLQWLRRATFDLTGLPPTAAEVSAFSADLERACDDQAKQERVYAETIERLLASPQYGERWASVWLDQIRYADSKGLGLDGRRNIWKYRDWVIDAYNDDMPFDEFTIRQLAGDLLEQPTIDDLVATASNRLTQSNDEGGTDDEEFRIAAVLDRVSTVWQTWQGITIGCVQCHSHPYDPISHEEFYQSVAFFNNTADSDLGEEYPILRVPLESKNNDAAVNLDREIRSLEESIWRRERDVVSDKNAHWRPITELRAEADKQTDIDVEIRDGTTEFFTTDTLSNGTTITLTGEIPAGVEELTAIRLTLAPRNLETAKADSEWGFVLSQIKASLLVPGEDVVHVLLDRVIGDEAHPFKDPDQSLNEKSRDGFAAYTRIHYPRTAVLVLDKPLAINRASNLDEPVELKIELKHSVNALGAFALVSRRGSLAVSDVADLQAQLGGEALVDQRERLAKAESQRKEIASTKVPIMRERPEHLSRPTHVFIRGLFLTKADRVEPGVPASMPPLVSAGGENADASAGSPPTRLTLAKWIASDNNPFTARVAVNRVWARLFGIGIVATEEDFGSSGERPSHPQLLDHLATRFQGEQSWSQKELLRSIVLSSTYRQDAASRPGLKARDPENRLLARGPRFRLPAEMVRDAALAASGLLTEKLHGPPVQPPIPAGIWKPFAGDPWKTPGTDDPDRYRRSIYTYTKRSIPYPMFAAFDAPSREFCTPRRLRSNTPLQALTTLNDTTFVECAEALASRMLNEHDEVGDQLRFGWITVATRDPNTAELAALKSLYQTCLDDGDPPDDAMQAVAAVLLNLDEIMSK
ncbi:PSD1 and planctomycete cytochrome C domain-containing protein [Allorhodopirellula solitaria]|uniref:Planctomycete cytochrome C n=1 Tax=Allorhodopirellula solitaria TaxID=2527987 RepID=A0A5C5XUN3_9BACT|nr:Planctomycete cytochrome C [Allorhodopirellula solitaria]